MTRTVTAILFAILALQASCAFTLDPKDVPRPGNASGPAISGTISGAITGGVAVTATGPVTANGTTDASGQYRITGLANGTYTVVPARANYVFNPASIQVTVNGTEVTGKDFTATWTCPGAWCSEELSAPGTDLYGLWGSSADDIWAVGRTLNNRGGVDHYDSAMLRWTGGVWNFVKGGPQDHSLFGVWVGGASDGWAAGAPGMVTLNWDGGGWSSVTNDYSSDTSKGAQGIWGSAVNDVWAVGQSGVALHWDGGAWRSTSAGATNLHGVWGTGPVETQITQLARISNVVTATTQTPHGYTVGQVVRISPGGSVGGIFAAVGSSVAATSPDGVTWTSQTIPTGSYNSVAWNGSVFVTVGSKAATSSDGVIWTQRTIPTGCSYNAIVWNGSTFVAVGYGATGYTAAATSPDGVTWTQQAIPAGTYYGIAWNGSIFVAVGNNIAATSPDGVTWTFRTIPTGTYQAVAWNGSTFVAVGFNSAAATSPDGVTWTQRAIPNSNYAVAWNGSIFAAVGGNTAATSPDGVTWTSGTIPTGSSYWSYRAVAWNGSFFIAVGLNTAAATSPDGVNWTLRTIPKPGSSYGAVAVSGALFISGEKVITSTPTPTTFTYAENGDNGTLTQVQTGVPLTAVATNVWAVGDNGVILHWQGSGWGLVSGTGTSQNLNAIWGSGPKDAWAVGASGTILHWNGSTWSVSAVPGGLTSPLYAIWGSSTNDVWAAGYQGTILHWTDGNWNSVPSGTTEALHAVWGSGANDVWTVGDNGTVLRWRQ